MYVASYSLSPLLKRALGRQFKHSQEQVYPILERRSDFCGIRGIKKGRVGVDALDIAEWKAVMRCGSAAYLRLLSGWMKSGGLDLLVNQAQQILVVLS